MSSENHASYAKIGFAVFAGTLAIAAALTYLAGVGDADQEVMVESYFDTSVSGLSVGSSVDFRGVKVGEVRDIDFAASLYPGTEIDTSTLQRIVVTMALNRRKFKASDGHSAEIIIKEYVAHGLHATISTSGITGLSHIELQIPEIPVEDKPVAWLPRYITVPPAPSMMDSLSSAAARLMNQIGSMDFASAWSNISEVAVRAANISRQVDQLLESQSTGVGAVVGNMEELSSSLKELSRRLEENPSLLIRPNDPAPLPETSGW